MRVLITGGAGFIGSNLAEKLIEINDDVIIIDNFNYAYHPSIKRQNIESFLNRIELIEKPVNCFTLAEDFKRLKPDIVIHLAAYAGVRPSFETPQLYCENNVTDTARLLELSRQSGVKKFIFASSSSVYGANTAPFCEDYLLKPLSPYAASKVAGEALCHAFYHAYGMSVTCLRFFTVYGPRQRPEMAIHKFTRMIDEGREIPVFDGGNSCRDYTYIDDIVDGIIASIQGEGFEIFNLGNGEEVRLTEVITLLEEVLRKKAKIQLLPHQRGDVLSTRACILKAQERLNYFPSVDIEEGITRFVEWYRAN